MLLGIEARGAPELAVLGDEFGESLRGPSGATGSTGLGPRSIHGTSESGTDSDSCAAIGVAIASKVKARMANHWGTARGSFGVPSVVELRLNGLSRLRGCSERSQQRYSGRAPSNEELAAFYGDQGHEALLAELGDLSNTQPLGRGE